MINYDNREPYQLLFLKKSKTCHLGSRTTKEKNQYNSTPKAKNQTHVQIQKCKVKKLSAIMAMPMLTLTHVTSSRNTFQSEVIKKETIN